MRSRQLLGKSVGAIPFAFLTVVPSFAYAGSCIYIQENMFAGPFDACREPVTEQQCMTIGTEGSNKVVSYHENIPCSQEKLVGECKTESGTTYYYTGNEDDLLVGCGFIGGKWDD